MSTKSKLISLFILLSILVSGCSKIENPITDATSATPTPTPTISEKEFDQALSQLSVSKDKFGEKGNFEIFYRFAIEDLLNIGSRSAAIWVDLSRVSKDQPPVFGVLTYYSFFDFSGHMLHNQWSIRSSEGRMTVEINPLERVDGDIYESGAATLNDNQIEQFCNILDSESSIKFRIAGDVDSISGAMSENLINGNRASCVVYHGLIQGYEP